MWQSCGCVFLCFFLYHLPWSCVQKTLKTSFLFCLWLLLLMTLQVGTSDVACNAVCRQGLCTRGPPVCYIGSSKKEWVLFWVGGDSERPHINPWYFQFPSKFQEKSDPVIYCKVCWNRAKLPFWLRLFPPVLLFFLLKHKQGKIDSWNGKNPWCGLTNTGLGWGGGSLLPHLFV